MSKLVRQASFKAASKLKRSLSLDARRSKSKGSSAIVRALKPEPKYVDYAFSGGSITGGTPGVFLLSPVGAGTDSTDRVGRKLNWKNFRIRFTVYQGSTATLANVRVIVFLDRQSNANLPIASDVVANVATSETATNWSNRERFKILVDEYLPNVGNSNDSVGTIDRFVKLNEPATFSSTANTITAYISGAIGMLIMSDQTITSASGTGDARAGYSVWTRCGFYDV